MTKIEFRRGDIRQGLKRGIFVGAGGFMLSLGFVVFIFFLVKGSNSQRELWCPVGIIIMIIGWRLVRHVTSSASEAISEIVG